MLFMYVLRWDAVKMAVVKKTSARNLSNNSRACNNMKCTFCSGPKTNISFTFLQDSNNGGM